MRAFVAGDPSAQPGGYDALAGTGDRKRISVDDVRTVNETMRARSRHSDWQAVFDDPQDWLAAIGDDLDIIEADEDEWHRANGSALVSEAIARCIRPGVALARATKVLHFKRPRVFPVLDEFVAQVMGVNLPEDPTRDQRIAIAQRLTSAIRREGRRNIDALRHIQDEIVNEGVELSLVRLLDIALWFSHPAASVDGASRRIEVLLRA